MTFLEYIKTRRPEFNLTDDDADYIMWEHTAYPCADRETVMQQINEYVDSLKLPEENKS